MRKVYIDIHFDQFSYQHLMGYTVRSKVKKEIIFNRYRTHYYKKEGKIYEWNNNLDQNETFKLFSSFVVDDQEDIDYTVIKLAFFIIL